jgi:hypothetical protein
MPVFEEGEREQAPMTPAGLCNSIPEIEEALSPFSRDAPGLLAHILRPGIYGYDLDIYEIAFQGGSPILIQNPHDAECDECQAAMRFLFQFGELVAEFPLADAGVGYVYGCDRHPDRCKVFVDTH